MNRFRQISKRVLSDIFILPFIAGRRLWQAAAMHRHRRRAQIGHSSKILFDGWIENPEGSPDRVVIGNNTIIRGNIFVFPHGGRISIGDWCFVGQNSYIWSSSNIEIGNRCLISHDVNIHDTNGHSINANIRHEQYKEIVYRGHPHDAPDIVASPIKIEDDAWIGFGATLLKGVHVGRGAIVASRSVVTEDVEAWTIVAGNPARLVRRIDPVDPVGQVP